MMTPDEMRRRAEQLQEVTVEADADVLSPTAQHWRMTAEICDRLDVLIAQHDIMLRQNVGSGWIPPPK